MSNLKSRQNQQPRKGIDLLPAEPLWKRAPGRDEEGRALSDFMMIIPGLCRQSSDYVQKTLTEIEGVLKLYGSAVVFAEMNLKINTLWVTVRPVPAEFNVPRNRSSLVSIQYLFTGPGPASLQLNSPSGRFLAAGREVGRSDQIVPLHKPDAYPVEARGVGAGAL